MVGQIDDFACRQLDRVCPSLKFQNNTITDAVWYITKIFSSSDPEQPVRLAIHPEVTRRLCNLNSNSMSHLIFHLPKLIIAVRMAKEERFPITPKVPNRTMYLYLRPQKRLPLILTIRPHPRLHIQLLFNNSRSLDLLRQPGLAGRISLLKQE